MDHLKTKSGLIWAVLLATILIFIFSPLYLYSKTAKQMYVSLGPVLLFFLISGSIFLILNVLAGWFLPSKIRSAWASLLMGIAIFTAVHLLFLLPSAPSGFWSIIEIVLWILFLFLCTFFSKTIYRYLPILSIIMVLFFSTFGTYLLFQKGKELVPGKKKVITGPIPPVMAQFSREKNVIVVILDGFQSDLFQEIISSGEGDYRSKLEGFTFFRETTGSFPTTKMSIPAMVSGINYQNHVPSVKFIRRALDNPGAIRNVLRSNQFEVDLLVPVVYRGPSGTFSHYFGVRKYHGLTESDYRYHDGLKLADRTLKVLLPRLLGDGILSDSSGFLRRILFKKNIEKSKYQGATLLLDEIIEKAEVVRDTPVYKMIHLLKPHPPYIVDENCQILKKTLPATKENRTIQCRCSLDHFIRFMDRLKDLGIYDSSLIILQSDHGLGNFIEWEKPANEIEGYSIINNQKYMSSIAGSAKPLTLIKPPYQQGTLKISSAQTAMTDLPATMYDLLGIESPAPGMSMFQIDPQVNRKRYFYFYRWRSAEWFREYFSRLDEFVIEGSALDINSWRLERTIFSPSKNLFRTGKIDFGTKSAFYHRQFGWTNTVTNKKTGFTYNRTVGSSASVFLTLPKDKNFTLTARLKARKIKDDQYVVVYVDGKQVGTWFLENPDSLTEYSVIMDPDQNRPNVSVIAFVMSKDPSGIKKDPFEVLFDYIKIGEPNHD